MCVRMADPTPPAKKPAGLSGASVLALLYAIGAGEASKEEVYTERRSEG